MFVIMQRLLRRVGAPKSAAAEAGQGLVEYAFIISFVIIVVLAVLILFGPEIGVRYAVAVEAMRCASQFADLDPAPDEILVQDGSGNCVVRDRAAFEGEVRARLGG